MNLFERAEEARLQCRYDEARHLYEEAIAMGVNPPGALLGLGHVLRMQGGFREALRRYEAAFRDVESEAERMDCLIGRALSLRALCRHAEAIPIFERLCRAYDENDDEEGLAYARWALAGARRISGEFGNAAENYEAARAIYSSLDDAAGLTYSFCGLGGLHRVMGDIQASGRFYRRAHHLAVERQDRFAESYSYCGLGNVARMQGDHAEAMRLFRKAEEGYAILGDRVSYAYTIWSMGTVHKCIGERSEAVRLFSRCLTYFEETEDPRGKVYSLTGIAETRGDPSSLSECAVLVRDYSLPWEALLVDVVRAVVSGQDTAGLAERFETFESAWRPIRRPLDIP